MATQNQPTISTYPPGYVDESTALQILGKTDSTLERLVQLGRVKSELVPRAGRKPERIYDEESLHAHLRTGRSNAKPDPSRALTVTRPPAKAELVLASDAAALLRELVDAIGKGKVEDEQEEREEVGTVPIERKLWLTYAEASAYSGLGRQELKAAVQRGDVKAGKMGRGGMWVLKRSDLDIYFG